LTATVCFAAASAMAQSTEKPTDPQIADIAYTAGQIDVTAANLALEKTKNRAVRSFAEDMARDHEAVNKQVLALLDKLKVEPEDNDTSKSLSGAAFDKAYVENEVAYHQNVSEALEKTLIPDAQNSQLKQLLETGLKLFKEHQKHAEHLVQELK
jgi:putative membrane protein